MIIEGQTFSYADITRRISKLQEILIQNTSKDIVGIVAVDSPDTYASILACWFCGKGYVPIHPLYPKERNAKILHEVNIDLVLSPTDNWMEFLPNDTEYEILYTSALTDKNESVLIMDVSPDVVYCILFTSGSTGIPKGVPLSLKNIACTFDAFLSLEYDLSKKDRFLQMYEFTFDQSIMSFLPTFYFGASMCTVGFNKIRYLEALKIMQTYEITFTILVPSTLALLRPFFSKIRLPHIKYNYIGGEPLPLELAEAWYNCVPNALVTNVYAPSEATMLCMGYNLSRNKEENIAHNGIVPFGTPWKNTTTIIIDDDMQIVEEGKVGELCFAGDNVMSGYLNQPALNKMVLFEKELDGQLRTFYRSGDMAFLRDGIYYTCGRIDLQVKVQGHKVELEEIEYESRKILQNPNVYALTGKTPKGTQEIYLVIKGAKQEETLLRAKLGEKLAPYMMPSSIKFVDELAYNDNGKIDRRVLKALFQ